MDILYNHLSDYTLKELYIAIMRAQDELMSKAPVTGAFNWYMESLYGKEQMVVLSGVWFEMYERGFFDNDNYVVR